MRLIRLLKRDLVKEISNWKENGIISESQAVQLCHLYGTDYHNPESHSYTYFILLALGYLFIGLAIITFLSANWDEIPRAVRMGSLIAMTLGVNLAGLWKFHHQQENHAVGFFFLGGLFYGASIMLIAQIYHIGEHFPDGIFWWAMGVLPMALLTRSILLMLLSVSLGFIWFFVEASLHFFPTLFPIFLLASAWYVLNVKQSNILFLSTLIGVALWLEYTLAWAQSGFSRFAFGAENVVLVAGIFLLFHGFSKWLVVRQNGWLIDYGTLLGVWVLRFAIFSMIIFSYEFTWKELISANWEQPDKTVLLAIGFSLSALVLVFLANKKINSNMISVAAFSLAYVLSVVFVTTLENDSHALAFQALDNIFLVSAGVWLIVRGIHQGISHYFYLGVSVILLIALLRYIDLVGNYVGATILFVIFAVILIGVARFWKSHNEQRWEYK